MRGWIVLYAFRDVYVLPRHYKTQKQALKFAEDHKRIPGYEAVVVNVEDLLVWINSGLSELEAMFKL